MENLHPKVNDEIPNKQAQKLSNSLRNKLPKIRAKYLTQMLFFFFFLEEKNAAVIHHAIILGAPQNVSNEIPEEAKHEAKKEHFDEVILTR